jgi:hypothetical protein
VDSPAWRVRRTAWLAFSGARRGRTVMTCWRCCVNAVICMPALWPPQVRPAPASHTVRLQLGLLDGVNAIPGSEKSGWLKKTQCSRSRGTFVSRVCRDSSPSSFGSMWLQKADCCQPTSRNAISKPATHYSTLTTNSPRYRLADC